MIKEITLTGFLVGQIWMPAEECWKDLRYSITREDLRSTAPMSLREHVLRATNDGDFQSCVIACGELRITRVTEHAGRRVEVTRSWSLDRFPSVADMLHDDPDWCRARIARSRGNRRVR